ncbi:hypothetical protein DNAM5_31 [Haloarcula californiae tailed virus 1]|uniref:Uncharacterized protein n=1 Tax=Haloarcula californiae tailed virus 1 TaxID=1273746 RepID=R4T819_9CAUD|nr:hypothetical protein M202_gp031 [Haloarcula californiae tailed virus 1]AGM11894.1 hypothetical protein DNAM5_31 [Haloarcula californiae tailed virus 1]
MSDNTQRVEVFQPRSTEQFYNREDDEVLNEEMFNLIRDLRSGFIEAEDLDFETFGRAYSLVGVETVEDANVPEDELLAHVFETWQNAPQTDTSDNFRESNDQQRATSLSTGDIVRVDGTAYLCESVGWSELEEVSV